MPGKETSGWESDPNDPTKNKASFDYDNGVIVSSGTQAKQKVLVITNSANGNYDVYKKTIFGDKLIYQYNASTNQPEIKNQADYNNFFTGKNAQQLVNLTSGVKGATLALSKKFATPQQYLELQNTTGYKSLANIEEPPDADDLVASTAVEEAPAPLSGDQEQGLTGAPPAPELPPPPVAGTNTELDLNHPYYTRQYAKDGEILKYPEADLTSFGFDYIQIIGHKYTTTHSLDSEKNKKAYTGAPTGNNFEDYKGVANKLGTVTKIIQLPMQPSLSESSSVDWSQDEINQLQILGAEIAKKGINELRRGSFDGGTFAQAFANIFSNTAEAAQQLITDPGLAPFITSYFAGQAVGANVMGRSTGQVLNNNLELLFKGPKLRQFSFNFTFTPRSDTEAATIKKMIRFFKRSMAPQISPERLFLYTPDIFQLQYIHNSSPDGHPYLNRFKPCALTNFSANYTPGNSYMTYKDGSMTQYQVAMTFSELEPIYQTDHDIAGGTGF